MESERLWFSSSVATLAVCSEYDKINGNPQLKKMLEQMREIAETMKQMTGQANAGTPAGIGDGAGGEGEA